MSDNELRDFVNEFRVGILGDRSSFLMCFAVCYPLQTLLDLCGVPTELVRADFFDTNHVWLRMEDGRIIDPTADQFGLEPVYIGPLPKSYEQRTARFLGAVDPVVGVTTT